jgi:DNA polymerase epsilon subunit 2
MAHASALGTAEARVTATRDRLNVIRQTILRNEHFTPSTVPTRDRKHLLTVCILCLFDECSH